MVSTSITTSWASREVIGVFIKEDPKTVEVKTARSATPVMIPKTAILMRDERKIRESEAFSADEMIDATRKLFGIDED